MRTTRKNLAALAVGVSALSLVAACGGSSGGTASSGSSAGSSAKPITISVAGWVPGAEQKTIDAFQEQAKQFTTKNPNIKIEGKEYQWAANTFAAQLAGGQVPTVFQVAFTEGKGLIQNKQIADLTKEVKAESYGAQFNPKLLANGQDAKGNIYGIPTAAYANALHYNRDLFTQAGLDPNKPPTTWDEVRQDAKIIAQKTGQAGYAQMTGAASGGGEGGWMLATLTATNGGQLEKDGKATVDTPQFKQSLQLLKDMRWTDNSMGANPIGLGWGDINQAFAAGKVGMYMSGSDVYTNLVTAQGMKPAQYGLTSIPTTGADGGVLGGGTLTVVSTKASAAEKSAAMKWIDFYYLGKLTNQDAAVNDAKTLQAANQPVGTPALPIFSKEQLDKTNEWIKSYVNVPLNQMTGFTSNVYNTKLVPEPQVSTQDVYKALQNSVVTVLTDKNANVDQVAASAQAAAASAISAS